MHIWILILVLTCGIRVSSAHRPGLSWVNYRDDDELLIRRDAFWERAYNSSSITEMLKKTVVDHDLKTLKILKDGTVSFDSALMRQFFEAIREARIPVSQKESDDSLRIFGDLMKSAHGETSLERILSYFPDVKWPLRSRTHGRARDRLIQCVRDLNGRRLFRKRSCGRSRVRQILKLLLSESHDSRDPTDEMTYRILLGLTTLEFNHVIPRKSAAKNIWGIIGKWTGTSIDWAMELTGIPAIGENYACLSIFLELGQHNTGLLRSLTNAFLGKNIRERYVYPLPVDLRGVKKSGRFYILLINYLLDNGIQIPLDHTETPDLSGETTLRVHYYYWWSSPEHTLDAAGLLSRILYCQGDGKWDIVKDMELLDLAEKIVHRLLQRPNMDFLRRYEKLSEAEGRNALRTITDAIVNFMLSPRHSSRSREITARGIVLMSGKIVPLSVFKAFQKLCETEDHGHVSCQIRDYLQHFSYTLLAPVEVKENVEVVENLKYSISLDGLKDYLDDGDPTHPMPTPELDESEQFDLVNYVLDRSFKSLDDEKRLAIWKSERGDAWYSFWDWFGQAPFFETVRNQVNFGDSSPSSLSRQLHDCLVLLFSPDGILGSQSCSQSMLKWLVVAPNERFDVQLPRDLFLEFQPDTLEILTRRDFLGVNSLRCFMLLRDVARADSFKPDELESAIASSEAYCAALLPPESSDEIETYSSDLVWFSNEYLSNIGDDVIMYLANAVLYGRLYKNPRKLMKQIVEQLQFSRKQRQSRADVLSINEPVALLTRLLPYRDVFVAVRRKLTLNKNEITAVLLEIKKMTRRSLSSRLPIDLDPRNWKHWWYSLKMRLKRLFSRR